MEGHAIPASPEALETVLRDDLAQGDASLSTITPILRHLLDSSGSSIFGDEIIAGVRGMIEDIARQLLDELAKAKGQADWRVQDACPAEELTAAFVESSALLRHLHALALENQLTTRMQSRLAIDPVLPPLLQGLVAAEDPGVSGTAMAFLAAQARFRQAQQRMKLHLTDLPGDLLHTVLMVMHTVAGGEAAGEQAAAAADRAIRTRFDEAKSRLGLASRLVAGMGGGAIAALSLENAGVSIFLSALSLASGLDRDLCMLATGESQLARLALSLGAAGLRPEAIVEQFFALHPDVVLPDGFDQLGPDRAAALLASAGF